MLSALDRRMREPGRRLTGEADLRHPRIRHERVADRSARAREHRHRALGNAGLHEHLASISAEIGVSDAGLTITGFPHASAGATFHVVIISGKFHGTISAHTPTGSRSTTSRPASCVGTTEPWCLLAAPAKYSNTSAAVLASQRALPMG